MRFNKQIILILVFLGLFLIFLNTHKAIVIDSYVNSLINPAQTFFNLFYSWDNSLLLGQPTTWGQTYLFPYSFAYYILSLFFNVSLCQTIVFALILWVGFYSFTKFIQNEFKTISIYSYIGGLFYIFNLYTLTNFSGVSVLLLPYVILPLQLYFLNKIFLSQKYFKYCLGLALATLFMGGINPPLVAINLIVMLVYFIHLVISYRLLEKTKSLLFKLFLSVSLTLLVNLYWIIGIFSFFHSSADIQSILSEPLSMQNQASTYLNVFRTLGLWAFGQGWDGISYFGYSPTYLNNPLLIFSMFLLPLIILSGAIFIEKKKPIFWVLILIILSIPMVVATNQGIFSNLYGWAYDHVPLFGMFRGSYKFIQIYIFGLAVLFAYLLTIIKKIKRKSVLAIFTLVLIILNSFPFFTNTIFREDSKIQDIPSYYYDAQKFFEKDTSTYRLLLLPVQYFAVFDWGKISADPEILFNKGLVVRQAGSSEQKSNKIVLSAYQYLLNKDYQNFEYLMRILNVKYIIQRNDFDWSYYKDISQPPEVISDILSKYKKIESFGKLDLYQISHDYLPLINSDDITFQKINSVKYRIYLKNISNQQDLSFLESFDQNWNLYLKQKPTNEWCKSLKEYNISASSAEHLPKSMITECISKQKFLEGNELSYFYQRPIFDSTHKVVFGYANQWIIDPQFIKQNFSKNYYTDNHDGSINIEVDLYFKPQSFFNLGLIISGGTILGCFGYLIYSSYLKRNKKSNKPQLSRSGINKDSGYV